MHPKRSVGAALVAAACAVGAAVGGTARADSSWGVSSSLADGATLPQFAKWEGVPVGDPPGGIDHVDFAVDGKVLWTEHNPPYFFNDDNNLFSSWLLGRGSHTLTVHAVAGSGEEATSTARVSVVSSPPAIPQGLRGKITRRVTSKDIRRYSTPERPVQIPPGRYTLQTSRNGLVHVRAPIGGTWVTLASATKTRFRIGPPALWLGAPDERGYICAPEHTFARYRWRKVHGGLRFEATGSDPCPNRQANLQGRWKRR